MFLKKVPKHIYRPVSVLPVISKISGNIVNSLRIAFKMSKYQCCFQKWFITQHCPLMLLEFWEQAVDQNKAFETLLEVLSKASDFLNHDLFIEKYHAWLQCSFCCEKQDEKRNFGFRKNLRKTFDLVLQ